MKIVNRTKHTVNIVDEDGKVTPVIPGGIEARLVSEAAKWLIDNK